MNSTEPAVPPAESGGVPPAANGKPRKSNYDCRFCGSSRVSDHIGGGRRVCYACNEYL